MAVVTPTADPCVLDVVDDMHFATATAPLDVYDLDASNGKARGTIVVCTGEHRFAVTIIVRPR